jgi:ectoine hydroxylase-related dioxygenase (phytanoyl-CoA dioxygenase family)
MDISEYGTSPNVDPLIKDIQAYGLFKHVVELEAYGMTVVPPEAMRSSEGFIDRLRNAIVGAYEKRTGAVVGDLATAPASAAPRGRKGWDLIEEDEVFVEAAINPVVLTLVRWLCGQSAIFGGQTWIIKGEGGPPLGLHSDSHGVPPGAGTIAHMCNASWICTDYESADDGPTVFIPGSHKYGRATLPHEGNLETTSFKTFPLIGRAGSLAIWNGATWHGSTPRKKPGLRVTLVQNYFRPYMRTMANYRGRLSPQLLQKYPELDRAIGRPLYPYDDPQGPESDRIAPLMRAGTDPWA